MTVSATKKKALGQVLSGINKKFGMDVVNFVSDIEEDLKVNFYKTPSHEFNSMLNGGFGKGRIVELYGAESSGKTSMALETIAYNMARDKDFTAAWFETEESYDPEYAELLGIDSNRFVYWDQQDTGAEQGLDILRALVASGEFNMIVVNSIAGLAPQKEIEDDMEKANIALKCGGTQ